jgi:hypothetical protein
MAGLNAKKKQGVAQGPQQEALEAGTYPCRVVEVIDLGVQPQRAFEGQPKPPVQHVRLTYEFTDEFCLDKDGNEQADKPRWLSEDIPFHPLSSDLAKSTKRYKAIDPKDNFDGDFTQLVGCPCNVTITATNGKGKNADNVYNNIAAVNAMRKRDADKCAELVNEPKVFLMEDPDKAVWAKLPKWLQEKIQAAIDYPDSALAKALGGSEGKAPDKKAKPDYDEDIEEGAAAGEDGEKPW